MANHCNNFVTISGSEGDITKIMVIFEHYQKEGLWYETYYNFLDLPLPIVNEDVYEEFGSKWFEPQIDSFDVSEGEAELSIWGESAWSPVIEFFRKISEKYNVRVEGEYDEVGCDFGGFYTIENGEMIRNDEMDYLSYRYLESGVEAVYNELEYYTKEAEGYTKEAITILEKTSGVMSEQDYSEVKEWIESKVKG